MTQIAVAKVGWSDYSISEYIQCISESIDGGNHDK